VGDEVEVKVISIDQERRRIGLSLRQLQQDPWEDHINEYKVGQLVEGVITRLVKFGAFARLDEHIEGLIHISELSEDRIEHPKEMVKEGDELVLRIIKIESDRRRIGLSLRKVDSSEFSEMDYEMTIAEGDKADEEDPGAELKKALNLVDSDEDPEAAAEEVTEQAEDVVEDMAEAVEEVAEEAKEEIEAPVAEAVEEAAEEASEEVADEAVAEAPTEEAETMADAIEEASEEDKAKKED
jgi:small subunit ribosomal protein S1